MDVRVAKSLQVLACVALLLSACSSPAQEAVRVPQLDAARAFGYLEEICKLGPRISGTEAMTKQQALLDAHFQKLGAQVRYQEFDVQHPQTGLPVRMRNMVVQWHPESTERVMLCCHYDTRPFPDQEPSEVNRTKTFLGANDGGSGVALLMELGHHMPSVRTRWGVDFVFFDGEELIYAAQKDKYFHGSEYFATQYRDNPPQKHRYVAGVLLDMVGGKNLSLSYEQNSLKYAPEVTRSVWDAAKRAGVKEFIPRPKHNVLDDHIPLNEIARIPTADLIDFDYPYWHKRNDLPAACSGESLAKVGKVLLVWLTSSPAGNQTGGGR